MAKKQKIVAPPMLDEKGRAPLKLNYPQTFKVGLAFAIIMMFWNAYDFVIPLLLENAYGLPNALRGLIMGLDNLLALFMLPLFGKLSDNAKGKLAQKWGRRTPFIVIGTIASVALIVFVPVATLKQQANANVVTQEIEAHLNDDAYMSALLTSWYEDAEAGKEGSQNFCDLAYLKQNNITKEHFVSIRFDDKMTSQKAILGLLGETTYYYDGVEVSLEDTLPDSTKTYQDIVDGNAEYKKYVATGINNYTSDMIYKKVTTQSGMGSLAVYMVILLLVLIAMATFRSPAVALMPDVTPKPLRSQANAIINLCGGIGGAISFLIYTIVLFGESINNYVIIFGAVGAGMLLLLGAFLALVKERKLVKECEEICKKYEIDDYAQDESADELALDSQPNGEAQQLADESDAQRAQAVVDESVVNEVEGAVADEPAIERGAVDEQTYQVAKEIVQGSKKKIPTPKEWWGAKSKQEQAKFKSFILILASIFMWFMGYNAISSNLSVYTTKALNLSAGIASIISGVSMGVSAIAFIPVGYMAAKIGRRKSIMIGFALAVVSFVLICAFVTPNEKAIIPAVLFSLFYLIAGFGLIIANVNTFPMVTELATAQTVGQYTGYYYVATMSAQAITPAIGGLVMDYIGNRYIFVYSAVCIVIAIVLMLFVKHGDSIQLARGRKFTKEEKKQIRLDSMDSAD